MPHSQTSVVTSRVDSMQLQIVKDKKEHARVPTSPRSAPTTRDNPPTPPTLPPPWSPPPPSGAVADRPVGRDSSNLLYGTSSPLAPAMCSQCAAGKCCRSSSAASLFTHLFPSVRKGAETECVWFAFSGWWSPAVSRCAPRRRPGGRRLEKVGFVRSPSAVCSLSLEECREAASMIVSGLLFIMVIVDELTILVGAWRCH